MSPRQPQTQRAVFADTWRPATVGNLLLTVAVTVLVLIHGKGIKQAGGEVNATKIFEIQINVAGLREEVRALTKQIDTRLNISDDEAQAARSKQGTVVVTMQADIRKKGEWYADLPVDFVFAWYNHTDPSRQEVWERLKPEGTVYGTEPNRGEVFFSIASVHKYAPWVKRIFVVTPPGQQLWLDLFEPELRAKVKLVGEDEFIPAEFLPTFSSMVVEAFLHRIPDLSEHFIYMNDDMMLGHTFAKSLVFSRTPGVMSVFMNDWSGVLKNEPSSTWQEAWQWPFFNAAGLMRNTFGVQLQWGWHAGYLLSRAGYKATWALYERELNQTASHPFRVYKSLTEGGDVVPHLLVQSVAVHLGLQELNEAYTLPWKNSNEVGEPKKEAQISWAHNDAVELQGLPKGLFEVQPGDPAATFVNFNKLQNIQDDAFLRWCTAMTQILGPAFDAQLQQCLCAKPGVGIAC